MNSALIHCSINPPSQCQSLLDNALYMAFATNSLVHFHSMAHSGEVSSYFRGARSRE